MKKTFWFLLFCIASVNLSFGQTAISGVINSYIDVSAINYGTKTISVSDASAFSVGDKVFVIQMQGATIDESQTASFGTISDYNDAGNFEIKTICNIQGNDIIFHNDFTNTYDPTGNVQLVNIPVYSDAIISGGDLTAQPWNGSTGGILILETTGTLDFGSQNIDLTEMGFSGGTAVPAGSGCSWVDDDSYYTSITDVDETALKGEGVATVIANKECGRGPQANGGGGGNNHNGGGCGGANYGEGGAGGERIKSSTFTCGSPAGINSNDLSAGYISTKIFLGGGGGAGHGNNPGLTGESGYNGGGIVIIIANQIEGNNQNIYANGGSATVNANSEGGGGGGAGGTVLLDVGSYNSTLNVFADGGTGTSVDNVGSSNCSGPGGGGGGGVVWITNSSQPANLNYSVNGGPSGITATTSQSNCTVGGSNGALDGLPGTLLFDLSIPHNIVINNSTVFACDSYTVPSGDETYTTSGIYQDTLIALDGCDSILSIDVTINTNSSSNVAVSECTQYTVPSGDETYMTSGIYMDTIPNFAGCDSILTIDLTISPIDTSLIQSGFTLTANSTGTYQWIDCSSGTPISGETNQSFTATTDGSYAVIITQDSCTDTSSCYTVSGTSIIENSFDNELLIYPNPWKQYFSVYFAEEQNSVEFILYDLAGNIVFQKNEQSCYEVKLGPDISDGIYLLKINSGEQHALIKLIKQ